jgi:hypothetical protein
LTETDAAAQEPFCNLLLVVDMSLFKPDFLLLVFLMYKRQGVDVLHT